MANQDNWLLARGERDGFPMIIRMATAYRGMGPLHGYDHHIIISAKLRSPTPAGFPSQEEGEDLQRFEENLCSAIEKDDNSISVLVITNNGLRDFIFYTRDPNGAKEKIDAAISELKGFEFSIAIEPDKSWEIYRAFDNMLTPPSRPNWSRGKSSVEALVERRSVTEPIARDPGLVRIERCLRFVMALVLPIRESLPLNLLGRRRPCGVDFANQVTMLVGPTKIHESELDQLMVPQ